MRLSAEARVMGLSAGCGALVALAVAVLLVLPEAARSAPSRDGAAAVAGLDAAPAARRPVYRTPGYRGTRRAPRTRRQAPPPPVVLSGTGHKPNALVDEAGTAHVVWTEEGGDQPDVLRYCRLPRGAGACDNPPETQRLVPPSPEGPGNAPGLSEDFDGPRVLALGDQLVLLTRRFPYGVPKPEGGRGDSTIYIWVSEDGGSAFTGPGVAGDGFMSGGAVAFTVGEDDRIATISDTVTGSTFLQVLCPGAFTAGSADLGGGRDRAYNGSLAVEGGRPVAAFSDLVPQTFVRRWTGAGDPQDPGTWTDEPPLPGGEPRLAAGPAGVFLMNRLRGFGGPYVVRDVSAGREPGPRVRVSTTDDVADDGDIFQDAAGGLHAGWVNRAASGGGAELLVRSSFDGGGGFRTPRPLARAGAIGQIDLAAAFDGGGFGVFRADGGIAAAPFGKQSGTGRAGLGSRSGGGLPPGTVERCQQVRFGAVRMLTEEGCLLGSSRRDGAKVTEGTLRLNGLEIVPDAGVKIVLNARKRTLDTTGAVRVLVRGSGVGEITLWHGELHIRLPDAGAGVLLASFDTSKFAAALKGFPIAGRIDVILERDAVRIPVYLKLPKEFGGIRGEATLRADNTRGLRLKTLLIDVPRTQIGPLELKKLRLKLDTGGERGDRWEGKFELGLPPRPAGGTLSASAIFEGGDFVRASVGVPLAPPGVPVFTGVFLTELTGAFGLRPLEIEAGVLFQAVNALRLRGVVNARFPSGAPAEFKASGTLSLLDWQFANARALFRTDGYFEANAAVSINLTIARASGQALIVVDGPAGAFGAEYDAEVCVRVPVLVYGSGRAVISSKGIGGCLGGVGSVAYPWGGDIPGDVDLSPGSCNLDDVEVRPRAAQAGGPSFTVARGSRLESLQVRGAGGPPGFALVSPTGERIDVAPAPEPGVRAWGGAVPETATTLVALPSPQPGTWRIEVAPESPPIAGIVQRTDTGPPRIRARLGRARGGRHVLRYQVERRPGMSVRFVERGEQSGGEIGVARRARGTIRFSPAAGRPGRRRIVAVIERDGLPTGERTVARYTAPRPRRPGRVRALRLRIGGSRLTVRFGRARHATRYAVQVATSRGMRRAYLVPARRRVVRARGLRRGDRVTVTVRGLTDQGLQGPTTRARGRRR